MKKKKGNEITQEQVSDTLTEGTIDGEIDQVYKDGSLKSHRGKKLKRQNESRK